MRCSSSVLVALLPLLPLLLVANVASAQNAAPPAPVAPADPALEARRLVEEGQRAFDAKEYGRAEEAFAAALRLQASFDVASNLGITQLRLDKHRDAAEHLDYAVRHFPPSESPDKRKALGDLLGQAKAKIASLRITVNVPGATITVNDRAAGAAPLGGEVFAEAGACTIKVEASGHAAKIERVEVGAGLSRDVSITLVAEVAPPPEEKAVWPYIVFGGLGAAGLGVGIGTIVASGGAAGNAEDLVCTDAACVSTGQESLDEANLLRGVGIGGFSLAGAAIVGLIVYAVVPGAEAESAATTGAMPWMTGDAGGLVVRGNF